jgi:predicted nucleotidyltransferase
MENKLMFVKNETKEIRKHILLDLKEIKTVCLKAFPNLLDIVLWGSFSFGEGRITTKNKIIKNISDYDIYIVLPGVPKKIKKEQYQLLNNFSGNVSFKILYSFLSKLKIQRKIEGKTIYTRLNEADKRPWLSKSILYDFEFKLITLNMIYNTLCKNNVYYNKKESYFPHNYKIMIPLAASFLKSRNLYYNYSINLKEIKKKKPNFLTNKEIIFLENELKDIKERDNNKNRQLIAREIANKLFLKTIKIKKIEELEKKMINLYTLNPRISLKYSLIYCYYSLKNKHKLNINAFIYQLLCKYYLVNSIDPENILNDNIKKSKFYASKFIRIKKGSRKEQFMDIYDRICQSAKKPFFTFYAKVK